METSSIMMRPGVVSIIVPCYNVAKYVDEALSSARNQTYPGLDIIAVNDGSTDDTLQILERHAREDRRIRVLNQANRGLPGARNAGMKLVEGEFVSFLDGDDVLLADKTERQVHYLHEHPEIDLAFSDFFLGDSELDRIGLTVIRIAEDRITDEFAVRNCFAVFAPLFRRTMMDSVGEFDETLRAAEDWDYWIRCSTAGKFGCVRGPVAIYRLHSGQMRLDYGRMSTASKQVINKHFRSDRRRYRCALASLYERNAKTFWHANERLRSGFYLVLSIFHQKIASFARAGV